MATDDAMTAGGAGRPATVAALLAEGRIGEAARRCAADGDHAQASALHERACEFREAALEAERAADLARALGLAVLARDAELTAALRVKLCATRGASAAAHVAADLSARGQLLEAARLWVVAGEPLAAAQAFERGGAALEAAQAYDLAGKPADAARVLESALRAPFGPGIDGAAAVADELRLALGRLYAKHGRHEAAVRHLQRIERGSTARAEALQLLGPSLERLGLAQALDDVRSELQSLPPAAANRSTAPPGAVAPHAPRPTTDAGTAASNANAGGAPVRLFGRYAVTREVVTTPQARLLEAVDEVTGERVAIKLYAAELRGAGRDAWHRFAREAEVLRQLRHPSVVELREFVPAGPALVMAWMGGGSLRDLLDREPLAPARAAEVAGAVLAALGAAHRRGILHRDVKPSNVLFDDAGAPRLADFGAAHFGAAGATVTAAEIGTAGYMAPEQRRGEAATASTDIYGVGMLLCEMLHGSLPSGEPRPSLWQRDLGEAHDRLVARLVAANPADRFSDAATARQELLAVAWPQRRVALPRPAPVRGTTPRAPRPASTRLASDERGASPTGAGRQRDCWLERDVLVLTDEPAMRERAGACARANHPALPLVLRVEPAARQIWVAAPRGQPLARTGARLDREQVAALRAALGALHAAGGRHGAVDAHHVFVDDGDATLAWPAEGAGNPDEPDELAALARLAGP